MCSVKSWSLLLEQNVLKRKGLPSAFSEAVVVDMGFIHECSLGDNAQQLFPLCSQPRATQVADKTGYKLTPPRAQVEKGFLTAQGDADSPEKLHNVRNSLE